MTKPFARQTKLKNIVGRSEYITDDKRQEYIVLHSEENMEYYWQEYADYEKQNRKNKEENIQGREIIIALPNELHQDHRKLKEVVDDYSKSLLGNNRDFEYAVHWNKEKTNLHAHIIYSERERQRQEPKTYKRDYYYNYEKGKMTNETDPDAVITKHKGDIKYNKRGEKEYTDKFSKKDTQFKSRDYNEKIKENLVKTLDKYNFKSRVFDNRIELSQAKLYKGARADYIEKVTESNKLRAEYNKMVVKAVEQGIMPMTIAIMAKQGIEKRVKEENSKTKSISVNSIEVLKENVQYLEKYIREKIELIENSISRKQSILQAEVTSLEDKTDQDINDLRNQIEENNNEIQNVSKKIDDVHNERSKLPRYNGEYDEVIKHDKIISSYQEMKQEIIGIKSGLKEVQKEYGKLKFYEIFKEKPLSIKHTELKEELEVLEKKVKDIDIDNHKKVREEINTKLIRVAETSNRLHKKENQYYNKINKLEEINKDYEEEIQDLQDSLKDKVFKLKNPEVVEKRKQENREEKTPSSNKILSVKTKSQENNDAEQQKPKPKLSVDRLKKTQKEIDSDKEEKIKKEQLKKSMNRSRGRGR